LRRVARLADGWLASAYNTTPADFTAAKAKLAEFLRRADRDDEGFPNGIATMFTYVTEDAGEARRVLEDVVARVVRRPVDQLRARLLIGPADLCLERLSRYAGAGAQRIGIWPVLNETQQLERLQACVASAPWFEPRPRSA
jgi:alkanesulfonate monooxygenase SsuD/methylene tetrahydromethanopterin reductase-like flavin-dependent oxidoreductase (luciferase family)